MRLPLLRYVRYACVPSPLILRKTLDTDAERLTLVVVLMLLASSEIEKPGMVVPYKPPSKLSDVDGFINAPRGRGRSKSKLKESPSDTTGVKETSGGATLDGTTVSDGGRSEEERRDSFEELFCTTELAGRLRSVGAGLGGPVALAPGVEGGGAEDKGVVNVFFTFEKREDMRA
jgi:hypothetical protein